MKSGNRLALTTSCLIVSWNGAIASWSLERCNSTSFIVAKELGAFRHGQDLSSPNNAMPTYVIYREHNSFLEIAYWMFFPYNFGKLVCAGPYSGCPPCLKAWGKCSCPPRCLGPHLFTTWSPRWRLGESLCSFPKSLRRLPDLLHLPVDAQQCNYKKVWW